MSKSALFEQSSSTKILEEQAVTAENVVEPLKILIVDDDPMTLLSLKKMFENDGKSVYTAENGDDALSLALESLPDMVITDWRMPKVSGIDLCRILRSTTITRHIYIIMLTGKESDEEHIQALEAGADDFVIKPFTPEVLAARMNSGERIIRFQQKIRQDHEIIQKYAAKLAAANRKLETMAMTDALTGLPNRRSALNRLKEEVSGSRRHKTPLSCIMIDIDHFKLINDSFGHDIGDRVLKKIADVFSVTARSYDMVSRIGGEEFLVICSRSTLPESKQLAERLRQAINSLRIPLEENTVQVTISLGVASWHEHMSNGEDMTKAADRALYRAKQQGRNRVESEEYSGGF
jgi:two-component system cell cycle response regulator